ncbi:MAG: hypothetical protein KME12_18725 [Trichocoleus desertorum ATA4-8-CV12]|jgi:hypothetical protein|nr:hypothetical protein [Trichocoleus desertorum ATA4-8-CV12]
MITLEDFQPWLNIDSLNHVMTEACREATISPQALYLFMQRYVRYGRNFSFAVPILSGIIGSSHLFQDPTHPIPAHAERSMDLGAKIFTASIEEFIDPRTGVSHRTLSYGLLDKLAEYANLSNAEIQEIAHSGSWLDNLLKQVQIAYQGQPDDLPSLVRAIGFHVATETVGDNEFSIINSVIFSQQRDRSFGHFIRNSKLNFSQGTVSPWYWIVVHGTLDTKGVEQRHSAEAFSALNDVVQYTSASEAQVIEWAGQGFAEFAQIQTSFFEQVQREVHNSVTALAV